MIARRSVRLTTMAIVLAFAAGATDAFAFLQLLGVFTANMTGNLVLAGLTERSGYSSSIGLSALAMACQTVVAKRLDGESGVTTTYVTGTLTSIMADAADRRPQDLRTRVGVLVALVLGALSGSLLIGVSPSLGAALPVVPAVVGLLLFLGKKP